jgi:hypothetical protein
LSPLTTGVGEDALKDWVRYALAVLAYIGVSFFTKNFLTWTSGPIFFILVLEVVPRGVRRLRGRRSDAAGVAR